MAPACLRLSARKLGHMGGRLILRALCPVLFQPARADQFDSELRHGCATAAAAARTAATPIIRAAFIRFLLGYFLQSYFREKLHLPGNIVNNHME
jgi:hypothetical protein